MSSVEATRAAVQLFWLRVRLPHLLAKRPLDALLAALTPDGPLTPGGCSFHELEGALDQAERVAERVPRLPRTCLYRCLARYAVFRRHGYPAELVLAVSPLGPDEDGHAWLELNGVPYREERAADFVVSYRYPTRPIA